MGDKHTKITQEIVDTLSSLWDSGQLPRPEATSITESSLSRENMDNVRVVIHSEGNLWFRC
jgi:hypothetical protein